MRRTILLARRYFWWPTLDADCREFVRGCAVCQRDKASTKKIPGLLQQPAIPEGKWQTVSLIKQFIIPFINMDSCILSSSSPSSSFTTFLWYALDYSVPRWSPQHLAREVYSILCRHLNFHPLFPTFRTLLQASSLTFLHPTWGDLLWHKHSSTKIATHPSNPLSFSILPRGNAAIPTAQTRMVR